MKSIRNMAFSALLAVGAFTMVTYTACTKDECEDVVCNNGGACVSGTCNCATGYEGTSCDTEVRKKFLKTWTASDKEVGGSDLPTYTPAIVAGASVTDVKISKFSDGYFIADVNATISGNTITIASQSPDDDGYKVAGSGTINTTDGKITWTYTITSNLGAVISYTGSWQ